MFQRIVFLAAVTALLLAFSLPCGADAEGENWKKDVLLTIDGEKYLAADYLSWWDNWQEKGMEIPESPESYIDWLLLSEEARRMELYTSPDYQKKVNTFLKVRSLLLLKNQEVDAKIKITDAEVRQRYEQAYVPLWQVNLIFFNTALEADTAYEKLLDGSVTVEDLHELEPEEGGAVTVRSTYQRPFNTHEEWQKILKEMDKSGFSKPLPLSNKYVILHLLDVHDPDEQDFLQVQSEIRKKLRKEQQSMLTSRLIDELMKKYNVQIDTERLAKIDVDAPDTELTDKAVMTYEGGQLSEIEFMKMYRRQEQQNRSLGVRSEERLSKEQVLSGIISQTFTTIEALSRHYEQKEPLADMFNFYLGHRLIKQLERQVFLPRVSVSDEDIKAYYSNNPEEFTVAGVYHLGIIQGSREELQSAWKKIILGDDFQHIARQIYPHAPAQKVMSEDQMDEELLKIVAGLNTGQVSQVVPYSGQYVIIKLLAKKAESLVPLGQQLSESIQEKIKQDKIEMLRSDFLHKLRNNAVIETDAAVWNKIYRHLTQDNEDVH